MSKQSRYAIYSFQSGLSLPILHETVMTCHRTGFKSPPFQYLLQPIMDNGEETNNNMIVLEDQVAEHFKKYYDISPIVDIKIPKDSNTLVVRLPMNMSLNVVQRFILMAIGYAKLFVKPTCDIQHDYPGSSRLRDLHTGTARLTFKGMTKDEMARFHTILKYCFWPGNGKPMMVQSSWEIAAESLADVSDSPVVNKAASSHKSNIEPVTENITKITTLNKDTDKSYMKALIGNGKNKSDREDEEYSIPPIDQ